MDNCVFCGIVAGKEPATILAEWSDAIAFVPLRGITETHALIVPKKHVRDALENPYLTGLTFQYAAEFAKRWDQANIWTSAGPAATQSIFHLHVHVIERTPGDQLMLPYGTTGNPHDPHWCKVAEELQQKLDDLNG